MKPRAGSLQEINKIDKLLTRLKENKKGHKIRNEREVTIDTTEIQRIIRKNWTICQQTGHLEEMDKFLENYNLPRLNQEETKSDQTDHFCWDWISNQKNPRKHKSWTRWIVPNIQRRINNLSSNTYPSQKIEEEGRIPISFYVASITLIPKPDKDITKKENYRPISLINRCKSSQQNISKPNPAID